MKDSTINYEVVNWDRLTDKNMTSHELWNNIAGVYLDYVNNWTDVERMAECYAITHEQLLGLLDLGKMLHNKKAVLY